METTQPDETAEERYAGLELRNGSVVIYDQENPTAWIQSDAAVACGELL